MKLFLLVIMSRLSEAARLSDAGYVDYAIDRAKHRGECQCEFYVRVELDRQKLCSAEQLGGCLDIMASLPPATQVVMMPLRAHRVPTVTKCAHWQGTALVRDSPAEATVTVTGKRKGQRLPCQGRNI